jgi:predicted RNase H-like HicB family nuclease
MKTIRYVYWQDDDFYLGYLEEFPDYLTQGTSLTELQENLRDILQDVTGGHIPQVRRVGELALA